MFWLYKWFILCVCLCFRCAVMSSGVCVTWAGQVKTVTPPLLWVICWCDPQPKHQVGQTFTFAWSSQENTEPVPLLGDPLPTHIKKIHAYDTSPKEADTQGLITLLKAQRSAVSKHISKVICIKWIHKSILPLVRCSLKHKIKQWHQQY